MNRFIALIAAGVGVALFSSGASAQTLAQVKQRGQVLCGVTPSVGGFALPDQQGNWTGLDVDYCRGIAAAAAVMAPQPGLICRMPVPAMNSSVWMKAGNRGPGGSPAVSDTSRSRMNWSTSAMRWLYIRI